MQTHSSSESMDSSSQGLDGIGAFGTETSGSFVSPLTVSKFLPGPRYIATYMLALPVIVVAAASTGPAQWVSALIAVTWLILAPLALYARWAALLLPIASALFLVLSIATLNFNSAAFVVDATIAAVMALVAFPRQWAQELAASRT